MSFIDWISGKTSKMKKEEDLKTVTEWHHKLKELGENVSIEELLEISKNGKNIRKKSMTYKAIFSLDEFYSFFKKTFPTKVKISSDIKDFIFRSHYKNCHFYVDSLELVIRAKQLSKEIDKCVEAINILELKQKGSGLSKEAETTLEGFNNQKEYMEKELQRILEVKLDERPSGGYNTRIEFNTSILKSEEEVLGMVNEVMKPKEEKGAVSGKESLPVKEMKEFLGTNRLPEDVTKELNETIDLIDSYLKSNKEEDDVEKLRIKAKVLVKSAKDYHHIAQ